MSTEFEPNLSILGEQQRQLWPDLRLVPPDFILCGGTAIALQLGHRTSIDFDFVSLQEFDPDLLYQQTPFLKGSRTIQKAANTISCIVDREGDVHVSFFGTPNLKRLRQPLISRDNGLRVASLLDLAAMKVAVVQKRPEAKDYLDIDALTKQGGISLPMALAAGRAMYGSSFNPELTLKSLCFFGDGNLDTLPLETRERLVTAVKSVDLGRLPIVPADADAD
jgi:hypothetical protein